MNELLDFGWTDQFRDRWQAMALAGTQPARVVADFGTSLKVATPQIITAELSGKLAHYAARDNTPKVGDWVAVRTTDNGNAVIEAVIPRRSEIARKVAGNQTIKQVIAANVDVAFVIIALDGDFSLPRLNRFLYQLSVNNIKPIIVLNKADKTANIAPYVDGLRALNLPVIVTAANSGVGVDQMLAYIPSGHTAILLGSSGVGKSTLTNYLLGREAQATQEVRASDDTGKHTTVHRQLFVLPGGGLLVDTPGIRELQLWGTTEDLDNNFDDVAHLISQCKYTTCQHHSEPGCAIRAALHNGTLDPAHYANYQKMKSELERLQKKTAARASQGNKRPRKSTARRSQDIADD